MIPFCLCCTGPFEFDFEEEQLNETNIRELVFEEAK